MSRVIHTESASRDRNKLCQSVVLALRELMKQTSPDDSSRDLVSYISLALLQIFESIDTSVIAWEKKGYWLKADRFRRDWEWTQIFGEKFGKAVREDDWGSVAVLAAQTGQKLFRVKVGVRNRIGTPWVGAYKYLQTKQT